MREIARAAGFPERSWNAGSVFTGRGPWQTVASRSQLSMHDITGEETEEEEQVMERYCEKQIIAVYKQHINLDVSVHYLSVLLRSPCITCVLLLS